MTEEKARRIAEAIYKRDRMTDVIDDMGEVVVRAWIEIILRES